MRAYELFEFSAKNLGLVIPKGLPNTDYPIRKPVLTLRHLNRLKHIRNNQNKARKAKMDLVATMYAG
ncbi:hypothetical protein V5T82_18080, partial [Magnetovibrio sp. PR-2]|uniref:hypothetical protein n=1 Tax=Magnetovibrio sp. PR-2 TaxID=3120356 RepID=UPI002FCE5C35